MDISSFLVLIISIVGSALLIASEADQIFDRRRKWYNRPTKKGRVILFCAFLLVILPLIQKHFQSKEEAKVSISNKRNQEIRDSIIQARHDSSLIAAAIEIKKEFDTDNLQQTLIISQTLGKYGFALDSGNRKLTKLILDSSKAKFKETDNPILSLTREDSKMGFMVDKMNLNKYKISLPFTSHDASSTGFSLTSYIITTDSAFENLKFVGKAPPLDFDLFIYKNANILKLMEIEKSEDFSFIFCGVQGKYYNSDKSKNFTINDLYYYNIKGNTSGRITGLTKKRVELFAKDF